jgi:hypothetical protein
MTTPFETVLAGFQLGESETLLKLDGKEAFSAAQLTLMAQARRELFILTPNFEPERYNEAAFADALSAFARRSRYSDARILVGDPKIALLWGHHVVALGKRLTSHLRIRQLHEDDYDPEESWMVADGIGMLRRDSSEGLKGSLSAKSIPYARRASDRFTELWERAAEIPDFRNLHI